MNLKKTGNFWIFENRQVQHKISRNGLITSFVIKKKKLNLFDQEAEPAVSRQIAYVKIFDELKNQWYSDADTKMKIVKAGVKDNALSIVKRYSGADFTTETIFSLDDDHLRWDVILHKESGKDRSMRICFCHPVWGYTWQVWAPTHGTPFPVGAVDAFYFSYPGRCEGRSTSIAIPCLALLNEKKDVGFTFLEPFEMKKPCVDFVYKEMEPEEGFDNYCIHNTLRKEMAKGPHLEIQNRYLGLRTGRDARASLLIKTHEGDWRAGMGWIVNKYKEYFFPQEKTINDVDATFFCGSPWHGVSTIKKLKKIGVQTIELHNWFPFYGVYYPEKKSWDGIGKIEGHKYVKMTHRKVNDHIEFLHKQGMSVFIYYNTREAYIDYVKDRFLQSMIKMENGQYLPTWMKCYYGNPDPQLPWGKHCIEQARKMLRGYPRTDGFFWDGFGRMFFDFAHDDGITMVNNKPCYCLPFAYDKIGELVCDMIHEEGMAVYGNKPATVEVQKHLDGIMVESPKVHFLAKEAFLAIGKPIVFLCNNIENPEMNLQYCLKYKALPFVLPYAPGAISGFKNQDIGLFRAYLPLFKLLRGASWVLTPHALKLPDGVDGNIFKRADGTYLISLLPVRKSAFDEGDSAKSLDIIVRLKEASSIKHVYLITVENKGKRKLRFDRKGRKLTIHVSGHAAASMIVCEK